MVLYRLYDAADELLYVGITVNSEQRIKSHRYNGRWGSLIARVEQDEVASSEAREIERNQIRRLRPRHNVLSATDSARTEVRAAARAHDGAGRQATIVRGKANTRYGFAANTSRARLVHLPARIYPAWRNGELISVGARWACGGIVSRAFLTDDPGYRQECQRCITATEVAA